MPVVVLDITVNKDTFDKDSFVLEKIDDSLGDLEGRDIDMKAPKVNPPPSCPHGSQRNLPLGAW